MRINKLFTLPLIIILVGCSNSDTTYKKVNFKYCQQTKDYKSYSYYSDEIFNEEATKFNPKLASASISFSLASFAAAEIPNYKDKSKYAKDFLNEIGFKEFETNQWYKEKPGTDTIGLLAAYKKINNYTIVALGVRGAGYYSEWASNFTIGDREDGYHEGFRTAADNCVNFAKEYITSKNIQGDIKLWAAGYSRGGATINIASGLIDESLARGEKPFGENVSLTKEHLYSYCFEAPQGAPNKRDDNNKIIVKSGDYNNIFNLINVNDVVPMITMSELGFTRYGIDLYLPDSLLNLDYKEHFSNMLNLYEKSDIYRALGDYAIDKFTIKGNKTAHAYSQGLFLKEIVSGLATIGLSNYHSIDEGEVLKHYKESIQEGLRNVFAVLYKSEVFKGSFVDIGMAMITDIGVLEEVDFLISDLLNEGAQTFIKDFKPILVRGLNNLRLDIDIDSTVNGIVDLLLALGYTFFDAAIHGRTYAVMSWFVKDNLKAIASAHYPEISAAHVRALDDSYVKNPFTKYNEMDGKYYKLTIKEDAKSIIIKNNNETIVDIEEGNEINNRISYIKKSHKYEIYLPYHEKYLVELGNSAEIALSYYDSYYQEYVDISASLDSNNSFVI